MTKARLEAFSDGVFAIIITIMVLEIKIPHEATLAALLHLAPEFTSYLVSFAFIGVYWVNHHHFLHTIKKVNVGILWANLLFLFPLTLVPFATGWIGELPHDTLPMIVYCVLMLGCGIGAYVLQLALVRGLPANDKLFLILKQNIRKTIISVVLYIIAIVCSFFYPLASLGVIALTSLVWIIPNREIEKLME